MISLEKWQILTPLQKLPKNVRYLGKFIVAKGFKKMSKVKKVAQSGHTDYHLPYHGEQKLSTTRQFYLTSDDGNGF